MNFKCWLWVPVLLACLFVVDQSQAAPPETDPLSFDAVEVPRPITPRDASKSKDRPTGEGASQATKRNASTSGWWTTTAGLLTVLGLIVGGARLFKKHLPGTTRYLPPEAVQVLGKRPLDYKQMVYLLRCGSKILIVGSSPQGMVTLGEINEPVEVDFLAGLCKTGDEQSGGQTFAQLFRQFQPQPAPEPAPRERLVREPSRVESALLEEVHG